MRKEEEKLRHRYHSTTVGTENYFDAEVVKAASTCNPGGGIEVNNGHCNDEDKARTKTWSWRFLLGKLGFFLNRYRPRSFLGYQSQRHATREVCDWLERHGMPQNKATLRIRWFLALIVACIFLLGDIRCKTRQHYKALKLWVRHRRLDRPSSTSPYLPVLISMRSRNETSSFSSSPRSATAPLPPSEVAEYPISSSKHRDYNGLLIHYLPNNNATRTIQQPDPSFNETEGHVYGPDDYDKKSVKNFDTYYAFDDDYVRNPIAGSHCRRVSWHRLHFPTCNIIHEYRMMKGKNRFLGRGAYRTVFLLRERNDKERFVMKAPRNIYGGAFETDNYEFMRMDALVMERLTSSPRIADVYGHCGLTTLTEYLPDGIEENVIYKDGYMKQEDLNDKNDVNPKNDYTPMEKLQMALDMAEAIAELHGFKDGVIVHDDIQLCQFLYTQDGRMKLNDFNRAEVMLFDEKSGEYCRYRNGEGPGNYRAPEEFADKPLNEKIDVYSFGNNIYALLTGLWVYYENEDDGVVHEKSIAGELPFVDERYYNRSYAERKLVEIMLRCWVYDPDKRVDIFEVVEFLREAVEKAKEYETSSRMFEK